MRSLLSCLCLLLMVQGCATNPVTGRSELSLMSRSQEVEVGREQYGPTKQSQGGEYTADPELGRYVSEVGQRVAAESDNELPYEFTVLNSSVPNAWALPGGKIAINRGLLVELNSEAELAAVLGHEVVHAAARHGAQSMTRGTLLQGALTAGALVTADNELAPYILGASQVGAQLISQRYGREAERESDAYGMRYMIAAGYDPRAAVSLQEVFVRLSEGQEQDWLSGLFSSHPPSTERVENNRELARELLAEYPDSDLFLGEESYQQAIAGLREDQPAYERMARAEQAQSNDNPEEALGLLDEAIDMVPEEPRFHGLRGNILLNEGRHEEALEAYDRALALDDGYFQHYLGRGLARSRLDRHDRAKADFEASAALLPTPLALYELGNLALARDDVATAREHFQQAAGGEGPAAERAREALQQLNQRAE